MLDISKMSTYSGGYTKGPTKVTQCRMCSEHGITKYIRWVENPNYDASLPKGKGNNQWQAHDAFKLDHNSQPSIHGNHEIAPNSIEIDYIQSKYIDRGLVTQPKSAEVVTATKDGSLESGAAIALLTDIKELLQALVKSTIELKPASEIFPPKVKE